MTIQWSHQKLDRSRLEISDEILEERAARITPFILQRGSLHRFKIPHLRNTAFTWDPENLVVVDYRVEGWVEVERGYTMHDCGYYGFFKPSIAEVLAQAPDNPEITGFFLRTNSVAVLSEGVGHICDVVWLKQTY